MLETVSGTAVTFGGILKADRYLRAGVVVLCAATLLFLFSPRGPQANWSAAASVAMLILIWRSLAGESNEGAERGSAPSRQEVRFWQDFRFAVICWLLWVVTERVTALAFPWTAWLSQWSQAIVGLLCAMTFAGLMLAIEGRPQLENRLRSLALERALIRPAVVIFIIMLFTYFEGLPLLSTEQVNEGDWGSHILRLLLALYLTIRCLQLARQSRDHKWASIFGTLAAAPALLATADLLRLLSLHRQQALALQVPELLDSMAMFLLLVTAALRRRPFAAAASLQPTSLPWQGGLESSGMTLAWTLSMPLVHIACYRLDLLAVELRPSRDVVTVAALVLLGSFALIQRQILDDRARTLWQRRREFQRNLRTSEADLRLLIEQGHSEREVRSSEKIFAKAFAASPDGLAISTLRDGILLEVNPRFEEIVGLRHEQLLGRSALSLGLWRKPSDFERLLKHLKTKGAVRELRRNVELPDGRRSSIRFSFDTIRVADEVLLLTVVRPIEEKEQLENALRHQADLLERSTQAVVALGPEERVALWNAAAERLYGISKRESLGRHWSELFVGRPESPDGEMIAAVTVQPRVGQRAGSTIHTISRFSGLLRSGGLCWISFEDEGFLL